MKRPWLLLIAIGLSTGLIACNSGHLEAAGGTESLSSLAGPSELQPVTSEHRQKAYRRASLIFLQSAPTPEQLSAVTTQAGYLSAIETLIESPKFIDKIRSYHQNFFDMQGTEDGVNFNEPANLAAYLVKENNDFRDILRADYCVNDKLEKSTCASFSNSEQKAQEHAAGVVTTKAFLKKWVGPFNFRRSSHMLQAFVCHDYPDDSDDGIFPDEISEDVHTFACTDCSPKCYSCHRTMNPRSSLFYTFDMNGVFNPSPGKAIAIKRDDGTVSTTADLLKDGVKPRYRQRNVASVKEYAHEMTRTTKFRTCLAKRLTLLSLGATGHEGDLPPLLKDVDGLMIRHKFAIKSFYRELLGSDEYVLQ